MVLKNQGRGHDTRNLGKLFVGKKGKTSRRGSVVDHKRRTGLAGPDSAIKGEKGNLSRLIFVTLASSASWGNTPEERTKKTSQDTGSKKTSEEEKKKTTRLNQRGPGPARTPGLAAQSKGNEAYVSQNQGKRHRGIAYRGNESGDQSQKTSRILDRKKRATHGFWTSPRSI